MSSKLQDIRQAVAAYTALQKDNTMTSLEFARKESDLAFDVITSVPDLLAIAEAAQAMRAEIKNIPQTVMTYHMYDVIADYDKAAAKLEGE